MKILRITTLFLLQFLADAAKGDSLVLEEILVNAEAASSAFAPHPPALDDSFSSSHLKLSDFDERLARDAADLVDYTPGVSRRANYWGVNTPTFQLRGFNAGDSSAYYKDGFRYQGRAPVSLANISSITILRGPQSALYGWLEPGGAVQLNTLPADGERLRKITLQGDSQGRQSVSAQLGGTVDAHSNYLLVVAHERGNTFRDGSSFAQTLFAPSLSSDLGDGRRLQIKLEILDDQRHTDYGIPAVGGKPAEVPIKRTYTETWGRQHSLSRRLTTQWSQAAWNGRLSLNWSWYDLRYLRYRDVEPYAVSGNSIKRWYENYPERYRWATAYLDWTRNIRGSTMQHTFSTRLEISREQRALTGGELDEYPAIDAYSPVYGQAWAASADFARYDQSWTNRSLALALQDEITTGRWTWLLGLRLGYLRQAFAYADHLPVAYAEQQRQQDLSLTPRVGANYRLTSDLAIYVNHGRGTMPVLPQNRSYNNNAFAPVQGSQWETGLRLQAPGRWLATLAYFDIRRENVLTGDPSHPGYSIQTGAQHSRGIELQWQGRLAPGWQLSAQGTWLDPHIEHDNRYAKGNRLPYAPRLSTSAWLTRSLAGENGEQWSIAGGFVHQGKRYANFDNSVQLPGYTRFDLGVTLRSGEWTSTLALENAANQRYFSSGVENRPAVIYPGSPRTLSLRVNRNFH